MSWKKTSRVGLVLCLASSLAASGCANTTWSRLLGKSEKPSANVTLAWGRLKEEEGGLTEARAAYEKVLAEQPNNVNAILGMARLNVKAQRLVDAEQGFVRAIEVQGKSPEVLSEVGKFYAQQQRWDKAIPLLQEAQRIEPHEKSHQFALGAALAQAGRASEAVPHFTEAVGEAAAHYNVGRLLIESGKSAEAEQHFAIALSKNPNLTDAQYFLAELKAGRSGTPTSQPIVADNAASATTRQVSASAIGKSGVTPVATSIPSGRAPLYPHAGYEELPTPPDDSGFGAGVTPASGFSAPAAPSGALQTSPPAGQGGGPQLRISTTQQMPIGH